MHNREFATGSNCSRIHRIYQQKSTWFESDFCITTLLTINNRQFCRNFAIWSQCFPQMSSKADALHINNCNIAQFLMVPFSSGIVHWKQFWPPSYAVGILLYYRFEHWLVSYNLTSWGKTTIFVHFPYIIVQKQAIFSELKPALHFIWMLHISWCKTCQHHGQYFNYFVLEMSPIAPKQTNENLWKCI